jgi:hypothetical protein
MKILVMFALSLCLNQQVFGQGTVVFLNYLPEAGLDAPVFNSDGKPALGGQYVAQLYAGANASSLTAVGPTASFFAPGYFGAGSTTVRAIPDIAPGGSGFAQVKVWSIYGASSYDQAVASNRKRGASEIFSIVTGGDVKEGSPVPSFPAALMGLKSFTLVGIEVIPEPSTTVMITIGFGLLVIAARRGR